MLTDNLILLTDSYKVGHWPQYPKGTTNLYSYFESRGGMFPETTFFGLQYFLETYLSKPVTMAMVDEAEAIYKLHFGTDTMFNRKGWEHIVNKHGGKLPIRIKAVKEGTSVKTHNVLMTVESTDPECFWLVNYLETLLSQIWYPTTVATLSREMKKLILRYLEKTGDPKLIDFKLHDFGFRGVSSVESAGIGGAAHLINFMGTDTVAALLVARKYYGAEMAGFSIGASEHSTITSWGQHDEKAAMKNMIEVYGQSGAPYACVSDSFDIYRACRDYWGTDLKDLVLNAKGTLVVRPDSGIPHVVVVKCLDILGEKFGYEINAKGYKVLHPKVRLIQGDGIDYEETRKILSEMERSGWSADNVAFGMGGGLLQKINRDTQKFAFKCASVVVNGHERDVFKAPVTDNGKKSKSGRMSLVMSNGEMVTIKGSDAKGDLLETVYENGEIKQKYSFAEIRERAAIKL
jgi:nicotinamide phosphoribosyltransferase